MSSGLPLLPLRLPYCHAWFENYFIECNIKLLDAFDNETLPVFQGFGSLMDQCYLQSFGRLCEWSGASKALNLYLLLRNTTCLRPVRSRNRGTRASERVDLEVCFSGPFEGGWAGSILKCSIIRSFLKINTYLSNHAWQYGTVLHPASVPHNSSFNLVFCSDCQNLRVNQKKLKKSRQV